MNGGQSALGRRTVCQLKSSASSGARHSIQAVGDQWRTVRALAADRPPAFFGDE
jgi:hypothetical protein